MQQAAVLRQVASAALVRNAVSSGLSRSLPRACAPRRRRSSALFVCCLREEVLDFADFEPETVKPQTRPNFCYGCGVELQTEDPSNLGYIRLEKLQIKLQHKQYEQLLCKRCIRLTQGELVPAVQDRQRSQKPDTVKNLLSPEELREQLKGVRNKKVLVVLLVDLLDLPGSFLSSIRPLIGMNPIFLVGTKVDLLPKGTSLREVKAWLRELALAKKLNVVDIHLVSSRKKTGISPATSSILRIRNGRDVYVMGLANVGKSAFVRALLSEMRTLGSVNFTVDALATGRFLPVESSMPGTTLGIIKLRALKRKGAVYDTPGVHIFHRLTHLVTPTVLRALLPGRPLSAYIPPSPQDICKQHAQKVALQTIDGIVTEEVAGRLMEDPEEISATYFWGSLVRLDIFEAPPRLGLAFFGASALKVHAFPLLKPDEADGYLTEGDVIRAAVSGEIDGRVVTTRYLEELENLRNEQGADGPSVGATADGQAVSGSPAETSKSSTPASEEDVQLKEDLEDEVSWRFFGRECAMNSGWAVAKTFDVECLGFEEALLDISVSGLPGWISVVVPLSRDGRDRGRFRGRIWGLKGVEVFVRPPIPVDNPLLA